MRFLLCLSLLLLSLTRRSNAWRVDSTIGRCREEYRAIYNPWIRGGGDGGGNHVEDDEYEYEEEEEEDMDVALPKKDEKVYQTSKKDILSFTKQKQTMSTKKQHYPSSLSCEAFELVGLWRLDQSIDEERLYDNSKQRKRKSSKTTATTSTTLLCAATIEFTANGNVIVEWQDPTDTTNTTMNPKTIIWTTHWKIRPSNASWRGKTTVIEFEARAFQGPNDRIPRMLLYKGYLHRKWTDRKVLQIVGELYLPLVSSSSSKRLKYHRRDRVGSFIARRRIDSSTIMNQDQYDEEEEEDDEEIRENDALHKEANSGEMENEDDEDVDEQ
jgi:hypothetical protein